MSRLTNDIEVINQAASNNVVALFANVLSLFGILAAMFILNYRLALVSVVVVPLLFWATGFIAKRTQKGFRDLQRNLGELNGVMEETISGQRVVKAFRRGKSALDTFEKSNQSVYQAGQTAQVFVPNPFAVDTLALLTVERGVIMRHQILHLPAGGSLVPVELSADDSPNIYVSITLLGQNEQGLPDGIGLLAFRHLPVALGRDIRRAE